MDNENSLNILIIEDDENDFLLIKNLIQKSGLKHKIKMVANKGQVLSFLEDVDLIIADFMLDGYTILEVIPQIVAIKPDLPIILFSGRLGEDLAVKAMQEGAWDYILKDKISLLLPAIERVVKLAAARREVQITQLRLKEAEKFEALGHMAAGVANDFNNIITNFRMSIDKLNLALRASQSSQMESYVTPLELSAKLGSYLTRQLITFCKDQKINYQVIDSDESIRQLEPLLQQMIGRRGQLRLNLDAEKFGVRLADGQLEQVILNLVGNAKDALLGEGSFIEVATRIQRESEADWLVLTVTDDGSGIHPSHLEKIFVPFFTTKSGKGTGIGLPMVKKIIEAAHGTIEVESHVGKGTKFQITLPAEVIVFKDSKNRALNEASEKPKVAVMDDDEMIAQTLTETLQRLGYEARSFVPSLFGADQLVEESFDYNVVLLDLNMGILNGLELAKRIRKKNPDLKIILLSGYVEESDLKEIQKHNFHFQMKPFDLIEISTLLNQKVGQVV